MNLKKYIFKYYNRNLTFDLPNLDSPNEPVLFLGFFASWIRIFICPCLFKCRYVRIRNTAIKNITFPCPDSPLLTSSRSPAFHEHGVCWICPPLTLCSAPLLPAWSRIRPLGFPFPAHLDAKPLSWACGAQWVYRRPLAICLTGLRGIR